jgi:capsular exopolysaccharide synthesis family protein
LQSHQQYQLRENNHSSKPGFIIGTNGKTLLIDGDLRRPSLNTRFNIPTYHGGLSNLIVGTKDNAECIYSDEKSNSKILPSGPIPANPLELLASVRFSQVLENLKAEFEFIVIDTPPTQAVSDPLIIAQCCDAVLYVVKFDSTRTSQIKNAFDRLLDVKTPIAGILLNQVDLSKNHGDDYDGYYTPYGYDSNTSGTR